MLKHILSAVQKHAAAEYPRECCGLIIRSGRSQRYVPCENTATDAGEEFRIAPKAYAEAEDQARSSPWCTAIPMPPADRVPQTSLCATPRA